MLRLERIQPASREGVFLNEDLVLTFSGELDLGSMTLDSFRVVNEAGRPARGRRTVAGRTLRFQPDPVLAADLSDGGYLPDTRYRVELRGFPCLGGLRGTQGEPLWGGELRWSFRTVAVAEGEERGLVFDDASPAIGHSLRLSTRLGSSAAAPYFRQRRTSGQPVWLLEPDDPILILCNEPLDPSTLRDADFRLRRAGGERIPVRARFLANHDEGEVPSGEPCAIIELLPVERLEPRDALLLDFTEDFALRDFGGNPVWRPGPSRVPDELEVIDDQLAPVDDHLVLDFLDSTRFIPLGVPGADGTALWGLEGTVGIRYPAAAGSGADGEVVLGEHEPRRDLHATRLELPAGQRCELPAGGLVVLRSQGTLTLRGDLVRSVSPLGAGEREDLYYRRMPRIELSRWLEEKRAAADEWTVLVAGGDLVIEGSVDVETPLLLVAGGRIRADEGRVRATDGCLWLLGRGGSLDFDPTASTPNLVIDPPLENPLAVPLRFASVSSQIPRSDALLRWKTPEVKGHRGLGSFRVRYLLADGPISGDAAVDHPRLLDDQGPIRLLIELEVGVPSATGPRAWDPPWIDHVRLGWEPLEGGR